VSLVAIAAPNLTLAALRMADTGALSGDPTGSIVVQVLIMTALLGIALAATRSQPRWDPLGTGVVLGLLLSLVTAALAGQPWTLQLPIFAQLGLGLLPVIGALALAHFLLTRTEVPMWGRLRLATASLLLAVAQFATYAPRTDSALIVLGMAALLVCAGLLCCTSLALVGWSIHESRHNVRLLHDRMARAEGTVREDLARFHEIGATVAGIASASRLISDPPIQLTVHRRHQIGEMIESEVARLERLMLGEVAAQRVFGLDDTIRRLVVRQQIQGQSVSWQPTDQRVWGCPDDVAEVLSILLDNAAKHGCRAGVTLEVAAFDGVVELVVTDKGPGISPEVCGQLFDWGIRGPDSPGRGIGLNIARDLAEKQGGYLMLEDSPGPGTTFVLGLVDGERNDAVGYIAG